MSEKRRCSLSSADEDVKFDSIMKEIGSHGLFQKRFNFVFVLLLCLVAMMPYHNIVLILSVPDHWCHVPGREAANLSMEHWKNLTLPK